MTKLKIQHIFTSNYHPQSNGKNEKSHAILKEFSRHYRNEKESDDTLSYAMLTYNCTTNRQTGYTPYKLQMGREPNTFFDENMDTRDLEDILETQRIITENKLRDALEYIESQQNQNSDPHPKPLPKIHKNDLVLIRNFNPKSFEELRKGPYRVLNETNQTSFEIKVGLERKMHHRCDIKGYFSVLDVAHNTTPGSDSVASTSGTL